MLELRKIFTTMLDIMPESHARNNYARQVQIMLDRYIMPSLARSDPRYIFYLTMD